MYVVFVKFPIILNHLSCVDINEHVFILACLNRWGGSLSPWSNHLLLALRSVFERSYAWSFDLNPLLSAVVSRYHRSVLKQSSSHKLLASELRLLLGEISLTASYGHLEQ